MLLAAAGFVEGHLRVVWLATALVISARAAGLLRQLDWAPFDRSEDYERPAPREACLRV